MTTPPTESDALCAILDRLAANLPDGPFRWEIEKAAAASRARALVAANRAARASATWGKT